MRLGPALALIIFVSSCDDAPENTLRSVENCINQNTSYLIDHNLIRAQCAAKYSAWIERPDLDGQMEFGTREVNLWIENTTKYHIITAVSIDINSDYDAPADRKIEIPRTRFTPSRTLSIKANRFFIDGLWIQPGDGASAVIDLDKISEVLPNLLEVLRGEGLRSNVYAWNYNGYKYVAIAVD